MKATSLIMSLGALAILNLSTNSRAQSVYVNNHNGNVYFAETDLKIGTGALPLEITRNYNSRTLHDGMFGFGWSSMFETFFETTPEGNIWVHEVGGGDTVLLTCGGFKPTDLDRTVDQIVSKMRQLPAFKSRPEQFWKQKTDELKTDTAVRIASARELGIAPRMASGSMECKTTAKGLQSMKRLPNGNWVRSRGNFGEERFDSKGRLVGIKTTAGEWLAFERDGKTGLISEARGMQGANFKFKYDSSGKVIAALLPGGKSVQYQYKDVPKARLLSVVTLPDGRKINYEYTSGVYVGDYNIKTIDNGIQKTTVAYDPMKDTVTKINDPDGTLRTFDYFTDSNNPQDRYGTRVKYIKEGKTIVDTKFEYWWKNKGDGTRYIYQTEKTEGGNGQASETVRTVYSACCSLPIEIVRNGKITKFDYTNEGLLISKVTPDGSKTELEYHPRFKKVTKVKRVSSEDLRPVEIVYDYDKSGNLFKAKAHDGRTIALTYDDRGRIKTMIGKEYGQISFQYNNSGRPSRIVQRNVGSIDVQYNEKGEITNVQSKSGAKIAHQVTNAFQNLLGLIAPAGVPLTAE